MTGPVRYAVGTYLLLLARSASILIFGNRAVVYASAADGRKRGANDFHTKGCEFCHRITGVGGDRAPDLDSVGLRKTSRQIQIQILKGGNSMPPFQQVLSKDEVRTSSRSLHLAGQMRLPAAAS